MTSTSNLADVVRHYQRSIERHNEDETRLLHCITKLFNLPITFEHLQETGIGKTVNALRKINGEVGIAAKTLVTKWKAMVAAEEEPPTSVASGGTGGGGGTQSSHGHSTEDDSHRSSNGRRSSDEDQDQENKGSNSSGGDEEYSSRSKHKSRHDHQRHSKSKSSSSGSKSHSSYSVVRVDHVTKKDSKSDTKEESKRHKNTNTGESHHKVGMLIDGIKKPVSSVTNSAGNPVGITITSRHHGSHSSNHKKSEHSSHRSSEHSGHRSSEHSGHRSSEHSSHRSSEHASHRKSRHEKKEEVAKVKSDKNKSASSSSSKSSKRTRTPERPDGDQPKNKKHKSKSKSDASGEEKKESKETAAAVDGFDSSMGANFDDVLGMLNMPMSGKKISSKPKTPSKTPSSAASSSASAPGKRSMATNNVPSTSSSSSNSRQSSTKKPDALASSAKLEPLDPSIALDLPTISNNYKPMPLNQTVMDVVFNHGVSSSNHRPMRSINESEALAAGISSKTMRTKIYSGVRTGQILQVPSLFDLCTRVLQKNIDALEYTGGVPFEVLRPVLERATPHQLLNFEEYNPYLMDDTDELWKQHVQRHCRSQRREEMETWREMFLRCEDEKERRLSTLAESIKASQKISEAPVRKTQLAFVDSMVKPPRSVMRKQEQYGTKGKMIATPAARVAALSSVTPNAAKVGDARLRVLNAARDTAQVAAAPMRNKKAPLMAKALQLIRGRQRR